MYTTLYALPRHVVLLLLSNYILEFVDEDALCAICFSRSRWCRQLVASVLIVTVKRQHLSVWHVVAQWAVELQKQESRSVSSFLCMAYVLLVSRFNFLCASLYLLCKSLLYYAISQKYGKVFSQSTYTIIRIWKLYLTSVSGTGVRSGDHTWSYSVAAEETWRRCVEWD